MTCTCIDYILKVNDPLNVNTCMAILAHECTHPAEQYGSNTFREVEFLL